MYCTYLDEYNFAITGVVIHRYLLSHLYIEHEPRKVHTHIVHTTYVDGYLLAIIVYTIKVTIIQFA